MIALGITAALLTVIFATRIGIRAGFGDGEIDIWLVAGVFRKKLRLGDSEKPARESEKEKPSVDEADSRPRTINNRAHKQEDKPPTKRRLSLDSFLNGYDKRELIKLAFRFTAKAIKMPRIDLLEFHYIAGGARADKIALRYGKVCAAIGVGLPFLNRVLRVKKQKITANLDYTLSKPKISGKIQITFTLGAAIALALWAFLEFRDCKNKGGLSDGKQATDH